MSGSHTSQSFPNRFNFHLFMCLFLNKLVREADEMSILQLKKSLTKKAFKNSERGGRKQLHKRKQDFSSY